MTMCSRSLTDNDIHLNIYIYWVLVPQYKDELFLTTQIYVELCAAFLLTAV